MRYMFIVSGSESLAESGPPPMELMEAIDKLGQEATRQGKMVSFGGLKPTSAGARMRITKGKIVTTDGPFSESKEVIGGFSIFNLASKKEALEEARRFTELHQRYWPKWEGEIEIREMFEEQDDIVATKIEATRATSAPRKPARKGASTAKVAKVARAK